MKRFKELIALIRTDGCTGVPDFDVFHCCQEHDFYYQYDVDVSREEADLILGKCIFERGIYNLNKVLEGKISFERVFGI